MMNKSTTTLAYGIALATVFAIAVTFVVSGLWPGMHTAQMLLDVYGTLGRFFCYRNLDIQPRIPD
jgi:hypothetical protein